MSGITNPAEAYFKDGLWGWDGSVWRKLPMLWGFSELYRETKDRPNVDAGDATTNFSTVPAGEIWIITQFCLLPSQKNASEVRLRALMDGEVSELKVVTMWTAGETIDCPGPIYLEKDDKLQYRYVGASGGDDFEGWASGYKMKIAE